MQSSTARVLCMQMDMRSNFMHVAFDLLLHRAAP